MDDLGRVLFAMVIKLLIAELTQLFLRAPIILSVSCRGSRQVAP